MACAPGARHFCDIYAASTTQPTSKAIFTLPKLWPVRSDTAGKLFLVHAMLHPSLTCFFRMVDVLRPHPGGCGRFSHMVGSDTQLFQSRHAQAVAQNGDGLLQLVDRRQGGGNADVAVLGVHAVGEGSPGGGHGDPGVPAQLQRPPGGSGHGIQTDEIAALGMAPPGDAPGGQVALQLLLHGPELGPQNGGVAAHQGQGGLLVLQIPDVAQLGGYVVETADFEGARAFEQFLANGVRFRRVFRRYETGMVEEAGHDLL